MTRNFLFINSKVIALSLFVLTLVYSCAVYMGPSAFINSEGNRCGFIQFYNGPKSTSPIYYRSFVGNARTAIIFEITDKGKAKIGEMQFHKYGSLSKLYDIPPSSLRVMTSVGLHHYTIEIDTAKLDLKVQIEEARLIPVRIDIAVIQMISDMATLGLSKNVRPSIFFNYTNAIDSLMNNLKNSSWETRWLSVVLLADLKAKQAENVLTDLANNDEDADVKEYAKMALKFINYTNSVSSDKYW